MVNRVNHYHFNELTLIPYRLRYPLRLVYGNVLPAGLWQGSRVLYKKLGFHDGGWQ